jgi:stringent starvation protein B
MTSTRPYLIRAIHEWACDNGFTPHLLVDATGNDVTVPTEFVKDGKIILNIAHSAVSNLSLGNDFISFNARFSGVAREIFVPTSAVRAIYARENGVGMVLPDDPSDVPCGYSEEFESVVGFLVEKLTTDQAPPIWLVAAAVRSESSRVKMSIKYTIPLSVTTSTLVASGLLDAISSCE